MLFIGRGFVLGLTGGQSILYPIKARDYHWFFQLGETNASASTTRSRSRSSSSRSALSCSPRRAGATRPSPPAATSRRRSMPASRRAGCASAPICCRRSARRSPGLMAVAQDKGVTPQDGLSAELIVIASVIIGGASILGGRGRVIGSLASAPLLVVLIDKVLREGWPITRIIIDRRRGSHGQGDLLAAGGRGPGLPRRPARHRGADRAVASSAGSVPARLWAWLRGKPPPPALEIGGVAIEGAQTKGAMATDTALTGARLRQVPGPARRAGHHPDRRAVARRPLSPARLLVEPAQHASRSCSTTPSWR